MQTRVITYKGNLFEAGDSKIVEIMEKWRSENPDCHIYGFDETRTMMINDNLECNVNITVTITYDKKDDKKDDLQIPKR